MAQALGHPDLVERLEFGGRWRRLVIEAALPRLSLHLVGALWPTAISFRGWRVCCKADLLASVL